MSKITVTTIAGLTSGGDANTVKIESGDAFQVVSGVTTLNGGVVLNENSADVDFRVESDNLDDALFVQGSDGNVGIGTNSPSDTLDVERASGVVTLGLQSRDRSDTRIHFGDNNDGDIGIINYAHSDDSMRFTTNASEAMRIDSSGEIFFGTTARPSATVGGSGFEPAANDRMILNLGCTTTANRNVAVFRNPNNAVGTINVSGTSTGFNTSSDYRLKENVVTDWDATTRLKQLKPSRFNFKADKDRTVDGFLAHEVSSIVPEAISGEKDAVDKEGNPEYQGIDQSKLVPLLTKALQEAIVKIETLEAKVTTLESK